MRTLARTALTVLTAAAVLAGAPGPASALPDGTTALMDRPTGSGALPTEGVAVSTVTRHSVSADGRFVVFSSGDDSLVPDDDNSATNVFRLDRNTGEVTQVNRATDGGQPSALSESTSPSVSADGQTVEFTSTATGLVADAPIFAVYVKDMVTGRLSLASRGNDDVAVPSAVSGTISGDGRHVVFTAFGVARAANGTGAADRFDVYVRDLLARTTRMVSVNDAGTPLGGVDISAEPDIDIEGDAVAFVSLAKGDAADGADTSDAFLRSGIGGSAEQTRFVSAALGRPPGGSVGSVAVASNGPTGDLRVAWTTAGVFMASVPFAGAVGAAVALDVPAQGGSRTTGARGSVGFEPTTSAQDRPTRLDFLTVDPLDPRDVNRLADVYGASVAAPGTPATLLTSGRENGRVSAAAGAPSGALVFGSAAPSLPDGDGVHAQVYLRAGATDANLLPHPAGAQTGPAALGTTAGGEGSAAHAVSDDGRAIAFASSASALGSPAFEVSEAFVRDVPSGTTTLVSATATGQAADDESGGVSVDAAGATVAFVSRATNLAVGENPLHRRHAYVRAVASGAPRLIDRRVDGGPLTGGVSEALLAADGHHAAYVSRSPDAPGAPSDGHDHVYVVDLDSGLTMLADRGPDGAPADASTDAMDLSGDASRVAFLSRGSNLGAPGTVTGSGREQVYLRTLTPGAQRTEWISVPEAGNAQSSNSLAVAVDRSGAHVAFTQRDPAFGFGMTTQSQVFVRDVAAGTTELASRGLQEVADRPAHQPSFSADGRRLTFVTAATTFPGARAGFEQAYLRDLTHRTTTLVSPTPGAPAAGARLGVVVAALSGNGACVALMSSSDDLVAGGYGPDVAHVFLHAAGADCPVVDRTDAGMGGGAGAGSDATGANAGAGGATTPPVDRTPPALRDARLVRTRFAVGQRSTASVARVVRGTVFAFTLSEPARTTVTIARRRTGVRRGTRCLTPRGRHGRACVRLSGAFTLTRPTTPAGAARIAFSGRTSKGALRPGRYQARLQAQDAAGNRSRTVTLTFTVVHG